MAVDRMVLSNATMNVARDVDPMMSQNLAVLGLELCSASFAKAGPGATVGSTGGSGLGTVDLDAGVSIAFSSIVIPRLTPSLRSLP